METLDLNGHHGFKKKHVAILLAVFFLLVTASIAAAIPVPAAGSFAFDAYDIGVNKVLKGPIGFVIGVLSIAFGAWAAMRTEIMMAMAAVLGGGILLSADTVVASLGMVI